MLNLPEPRLTHFGEELWYRLASPVLNIPVEVLEWDVQFLGERLAHGGLAGTHITNQEYSFHHLKMRSELISHFS